MPLNEGDIVAISTILDPADVRLTEQDDALCLVYQDKRSSDLSVVQCFPETDPGLWVSLRNTEGSEIGLISDLGELDVESRRIVDRRLRERYHIPEITRITRVERGPEGAQCFVDTEEGEYVILVRSEGDADTRSFPRVVLTDGPSGRRYRISDYTSLDRSSQALARQHLSIARRGGRGGRHYR